MTTANAMAIAMYSVSAYDRFDTLDDVKRRELIEELTTLSLTQPLQQMPLEKFEIKTIGIQLTSYQILAYLSAYIIWKAKGKNPDPKNSLTRAALMGWHLRTTTEQA